MSLFNFIVFKRKEKISILTESIIYNNLIRYQVLISQENRNYIQIYSKFMGGVKSLTNMYTYNEYMYYYINKKDAAKVEEILKKKPSLISDPITPTSKVTALIQACSVNSLELVELLITKYEADPNLASPKGETPLIASIRKNHIQMVKYLLEKGADPNYVDKAGFKTIQYAILQGLYEIAFVLYAKIQEKQLRIPDEYAEMGKKFSYRYVNYQMFLEELQKGIEPEKAGDFLKKKRIILSDPVIDPRETWGQWFSRNLDFKDPPMVERASLPPELRPQNQRFGKINHFFGRIALTPASQKPQFKPQTQSEYDMESRNYVMREKQEKVEIQTVS